MVQALSKQQLEALVHNQGERDKDSLVVLYAPWCQYSQVSCSFLLLWVHCHSKAILQFLQVSGHVQPLSGSKRM